MGVCALPFFLQKNIRVFVACQYFQAVENWYFINLTNRINFINIALSIRWKLFLWCG